MPIYECGNCGKFASLSPGYCWKCGKALSPKGPGGAGGGPGHGGGGPPPPGTKPVYRCHGCARYAALSPGMCLLCGAQLVTHHEPAGEVGRLRTLNDGAQRICDQLELAQGELLRLLTTFSQTQRSTSYKWTPSFLYGAVAGDPRQNTITQLNSLRGKLQSYRQQLLALRQSANPRVQRISNLHARPTADVVIDFIDRLLELINDRMQIIDDVLIKLRR